MRRSYPQTVTLGGVQIDAVTGGHEDNLRRVEHHLRTLSARGARLAVLPELFSNGYVFDPEYAEAGDGPTVTKLTELADELDISIATALLMRSGDTLTDRAMIIGPAGVLAAADKTYLWGGESGYLTPGDRSGAVAETAVGVVGVSICYEAGFPEMVRDLALRGAQIIAVPAAFGRPRLHAWELLTRSRALENGCVVVAAGLTGDNGRGVEFAGHSRIVGPRGEVRATLGYEEGVVSCAIDLDEIKSARIEIPYLTELTLRQPHNGDTNQIAGSPTSPTQPEPQRS